MQRKTPIALALGVAWGLISPAMADQTTASSEPAATRLDEVTVISTRTERRIDDVPDTVTTLSAERIQQRGARDIKDVFRNEIDVSVLSAPTRFSAARAATGRAGTNASINIRGLEGNQVLITVDGIRMPTSFEFGNIATGRGDFININGVKNLEVLRGPASTQYGSDGLAGAVTFTTLDPADVLTPGARRGGFVRESYSSVDRSWNTTLAGAFRSGDFQGMALGSYSSGHEVATHGDNGASDKTRTKADPADYTKKYGLGKLYWSASPEHLFGLTLEGLRRSQDTNVLSNVDVPPLAASSVQGLTAHDTLKRDRVSLSYRYDNPDNALLQKGDVRVFHQTADTRQETLEDRYTAADRVRIGTYKQTVTGLAANAESRIDGKVRQRLAYGIDWSLTRVSGLRDGTVAPVGESFPGKVFPDTDYTLAGAYVQDEIELGSLTLIPGLRFDQYRLQPKQEGYSGQAVTLGDHAVTPRFGVIWHVSEALSPYGQWSRGFRAPTPDQVNNSFGNPVYNYMTVGNPDLKPEKANSIEVGIRGRIDGWRYSLAAYDNHYDDFIEQQVVRGKMTRQDPLIYQYINLKKAHIKGVELRSDWQVDTRWTVNGGLAWSRGDSEQNGVSVPLLTVQPLRVVLGANYDAGWIGGRINVQHNAAKSANRAPVPGAQEGIKSYYLPSASTVVDVGMFWKPRKDLTVNATINNVFDSRYWLWSNVRAVDGSSTVKDAFSEPGRNVQLSVRYDF